LNLLPECFCVRLYQFEVILILVSRFLERCLPCYHVKQDHANSEHIGLSWLVLHL